MPNNCVGSDCRRQGVICARHAWTGQSDATLAQGEPERAGEGLGDA